jgi:hypothetical protein
MRRAVASGQVEGTRNDADSAITEDPPIPLELVVTIRESTDRKKLIFRLASGDALELARDDPLYRRRPKAKPIDKSIEDASRTLSELVIVLSQGSSSENDIINLLARAHSDASIHRALRAALAQGLIEQKVGFGRVFREVRAVFSVRSDARLRRNCMLSLSQAGKAWGLADDAPEFQRGESEASEPKIAPTTVNYIYPTINAVMFQQASRTQDSCSREDLKT